MPEGVGDPTPPTCSAFPPLIFDCSINLSEFAAFPPGPDDT